MTPCQQGSGQRALTNFWCQFMAASWTCLYICSDIRNLVFIRHIARKGASDFIENWDVQVCALGQSHFCEHEGSGMEDAQRLSRLAQPGKNVYGFAARKFSPQVYLWSKNDHAWFFQFGSVFFARFRRRLQSTWPLAFGSSMKTSFVGDRKSVV